MKLTIFHRFKLVTKRCKASNNNDRKSIKQLYKACGSDACDVKSPCQDTNERNRKLHTLNAPSPVLVNWPRASSPSAYHIIGSVPGMIELISLGLLTTANGASHLAMSNIQKTASDEARQSLPSKPPDALPFITLNFLFWFLIHIRPSLHLLA